MTLSERLAAKGLGPDGKPLADDVVDLRDDREELAALRAVVRSLVIAPADTTGHAYYCAAWLDATDAEHEAIQRALAATPEELAVFRKAQEAQDG